MTHDIIARMTPIEYLKICKLAVKQNYDALQYVLASKMTPIEYFKICVDVVKDKYNALEHVKANKMTQEEYFYICDLAFQKFGSALEYVPYDLRTFIICMKAVEYDSYALRFVPKEKMTIKEYLEICKLAVQKYGCALQYVDDERITKTIIQLALINNNDSFKFVPDEFKKYF